MDRNITVQPATQATVVALRKESVDRNRAYNQRRTACKRSLSARRAWIEIRIGYLRPGRFLSLSARRAWIEISSCQCSVGLIHVALRKESVDRNCPARRAVACLRRSLSARRAWIEISARSLRSTAKTASLSARRAWIEMAGQPAHGLPRMGRSPQGERG